MSSDVSELTDHFSRKRSRNLVDDDDHDQDDRDKDDYFDLKVTVGRSKSKRVYTVIGVCKQTHTFFTTHNLFI